VEHWWNVLGVGLRSGSVSRSSPTLGSLDHYCEAFIAQGGPSDGHGQVAGGIYATLLCQGALITSTTDTALEVVARTVAVMVALSRGVPRQTGADRRE